MSENGYKPVTRQRRARADYDGFSSQPRFKIQGSDLNSPRDFFNTIYKFTQTVQLTDPGYVPDSRERDIWLNKVVQLEPHLMGVLSSVVDIDKNRGWKMIGGRNQVKRFTDILHNIQVAPGVYGWRHGISASSRSFWSTDMGSVGEIGRQGRNGPMSAIYHVDPTTVRLTGNMDYPMEYFAPKQRTKKPILWRPEDYFRAASFIDYREDYNGLGLCAVSRAIELAKLMVAIYEHNRETLGAKAPRGLLLLEGITRNQWNSAMQAGEDDLTGMDLDYFQAVAVLASQRKVDAKLIALSQLPQSFNMREWMDMLIYGYALCFGFDPSEFYPVQFGALGRGTESEMQHEKATGKGRLDFVLTYQEQLQEFLPDSLSFQFDQRDEKGDLLHAEVNQAWANVAKTLYKDSALLNDQQSLSILADWGVIPRAWVPTEASEETDQDEFEDEELLEDGEDSGERIEGQGEDEPAEMDEPVELEPAGRVLKPKFRNYRDELRESDYVRRAAELFPSEPIVQYSYPGNTLTVLWDRGDEVYRKRVFRGR